MTEPRLKSQIIAQAIIRYYEMQLVPIYVRHSGDKDAGALMILISLPGNICALYTQSYDLEGRRQWLRISGADPIPAEAAEARLEKALRLDPDLWILEIEEREDRALFKNIF